MSSTDSAPSQKLRRPMIRRLVLADFRSYASLDIDIEAPIVALTGDNGAGKTNVLEALSMFTPGRGLRRADLADMARSGGAGGWAVSVEAETPDGRMQFGTGLDPAEGQTRRCRIERTPVGSARAFADHLRVVWLTPAMDGLFSGSAGERRRFLDRLVLAVDADHGSRVNALEKALRNRNRLLEQGVRDRVWLDAAERELAEIAVAVSAARYETVSHLTALIDCDRDAASPFPWAEIELDGAIERLIPDLPALEIEDRYRRLLADNRARDAAAGRTLIGPQACDLVVVHGPKQAAASRCSTGEQKALLVGLVLAHARLVAAMSGIAPLVLLDEIAAHFDPSRRAALYCALEKLGAQVFMTGADIAAFEDVASRAQILMVAAGQISRIS
jgi:DNA replication and repair protein RecF